MGRIVRGEQDDQRIVDEVQLLQTQNRLAIVIQIEAVRVASPH